MQAWYGDAGGRAGADAAVVALDIDPIKLELAKHNGAETLLPYLIH